MSAGKVLKSYVWWTHERGSVHYDVMVTLILAFIFLTPLWVHYGDQPKPDLAANQILASVDPAGGMVYKVPAALIHAAGPAPTAQELAAAIAPVSGAVTVNRWEPVREIGGQIVAWRVWGARATPVTQ